MSIRMTKTNLLFQTCSQSLDHATSSTWGSALVALVVIVNVMMYLAFVQWTNRLQSSQESYNPCTCSKDWRAALVKFYPPVAILIIFGLLYAAHAGVLMSLQLVSLISIGIVIGFIVTCYAGISYIMSMIDYNKTHTCECATRMTMQNNGEEAMTAFKLSLVMASTLTVGILLAFVSHQLAMRGG
jgi:hypothetical protein